MTPSSEGMKKHKKKNRSIELHTSVQNTMLHFSLKLKCIL